MGILKTYCNKKPASGGFFVAVRFLALVTFSLSGVAA